MTKAKNFIEEIAKAAKIVPSEELALIAGQLKCKYSISLADCRTLATGKQKSIPALLLIGEKEIIENLDELQKIVKIEFFKK